MGLPVVAVDVGDVAEMLADVAPSAVVPFPMGRSQREGRNELIRHLADQAAEVLADTRRANGREQNAWLDWPNIAERIVTVYRQVIG